MLEAQQEMMSTWINMQKKVADNAVNGTAKAAAEQETKSRNWMEWLAGQQQKLADITKTGDTAKMMEEGTESFSRWMEWQTEFAEQWLKYAQSTGITGQRKAAETPADFMKQSFSAAETMMKQSRDLFKSNLFRLMPETMQPYYNQYEASVDHLMKHWGDIAKVITGEKGNTAFSNWYTPDMYADFISKYTGMHTMGDLNTMMDNARKLMDNMASIAGKPEDRIAWWNNWNEEMKKAGFTPWTTMGSSVSDMFRSRMEPWLNMLQPGREEKMMRLLTDLQFAYMTYLTRSMQVQMLVMEGTRVAMPKTIEQMSTAYKPGEAMPEFKAFYQAFTDNMETMMTGVLHTAEYSRLQSEMAASGVRVKQLTNQLTEMALEDTPLVTRSLLDDYAIETKALRDKIRMLENRLNELENTAGKKTATPAAKTGRTGKAKTAEV